MTLLHPIAVVDQVIEEYRSYLRTEFRAHGPGSLVEPSANINDLAAHDVLRRDNSSEGPERNGIDRAA